MFVRSARAFQHALPLCSSIFSPLSLSAAAFFSNFCQSSVPAVTRRDRGGNYVITSAVLITSCLFVTFSTELRVAARRFSRFPPMLVAERWNVSIGCTRKFSHHPVRLLLLLLLFLFLFLRLFARLIYLRKKDRAAANYNFPRVLVTLRRRGGEKYARRLQSMPIASLSMNTSDCTSSKPSNDEY